ncbi:LacI family DNA-binding transcriptional regulator [Pseudonocardia sp. CA-107938]|uniref:LacI family DNA-binding transcriptional regulator n=1 Tax=Pseudonocardia sp. CA-107938 TaxID=3240021 RepID=UPI003D92B69A
MTDVARAAGVSYQTVSRVINESDRVHPDTRARVQAAIDELGYHPNSAARALVTGRDSTIAVVASNTSLYGYARTLEGIEDAAWSAGYTVHITVLQSPDHSDRVDAVERLLSQPHAGLIAFTQDDLARAAVERVPPRTPTVTAFGTGVGDRGHVMIDEQAGAEAATRYLLDLGHRTVHHVAVPPLLPSGRLLGWRTALERAGAPVPEPLEVNWTPRSGYEAGAQLARRSDVTAVLAVNDDVATGIVRAAMDIGRDVPGDLSVVGFDDTPLAAYVRPSLTTVTQDFLELGRRAFALLHAQLEQGTPPPTCVRLPAELVVRESSGPPRGPDTAER